MPNYDVTDIFTPAGVPTVTYVDRQSNDLEKRLKQGLATKGLIVSVSGPSKSGKTVLIKKVIPEDNLITISGGAIKTADDLWSRVLAWMEAPSEISLRASASQSSEVSGTAAASASIPLITQGSAQLSGKFGDTKAEEVTQKYSRNGIDAVVAEIGNSAFTVFIDDFHYMPPNTQTEVAKQIKEASEKGVRICTASVPHRSDDVVRSNPELRGRVQAIDFEYWERAEIREIAVRGFEALKISFETNLIDKIVEEAFGSPQLMQSMCLQACFVLGILETQSEIKTIIPTEVELAKILEQTSSTTDFSSLLDALHSGAKTRGQERTKYKFIDNSTGDVYRCILLAIKQNPPRLTLPYDEIYVRTRAVCDGSAPSGSSISEALSQMHRISEDIQADAKVLEWSEDVLDIADPYFFFFLRCSKRLSKIRRD